MQRKKCCVPNCKNPKYPVRYFPSKNNTRCETWLNQINCPILKSISRTSLYVNKYICSAHFEGKYISRNNRLYTSAIPTLFGSSQNEYPMRSFPSNDDTRLDIWVNQISCPILKSMPRTALQKNKFICSTHFEGKYISRNNKLYHNAIPTLFDSLQNTTKSDSVSEEKKKIQSAADLEQLLSFEEEDDPSWRMPITMTNTPAVVTDNADQTPKKIILPEDQQNETKLILTPLNKIISPTEVLVIDGTIEDFPGNHFISEERSVSPAKIKETAPDNLELTVSGTSQEYQIKEAPRILVLVPFSCVNKKESDCVRFLRKQANVLNLAIKVITLVPEKPVVVLTWIGSHPELPAILLNSHMDVVPVSEEHWDRPPFAAEMDSKGNIFARGSQDMKCVGIMYLEAIRRLKIKGIPLKRTIHLSFMPDEEIGSKDGMDIFSTSKKFQELNIGFSLDEGLVHDGEEFIVFYAEKIIWQLHVHCGGTPGHGCSLQGNTSGEKFRYIINKFLDYRDREQKLNGGLVLPGDDVSAVNLTKVYGGLQENIIPDQLTAVFDIRHSIKQNLIEFEEMINKWCKEAGPNVTIEYRKKEVLGGVTVLDETNPFWVAFKSVTDKLNMKLETVTCPGTTDSRFIRLLGIPALGFTPINKTPMRLHAHNEFVNKDSLLRGIQIYCEILTAIANV